MKKQYDPKELFDCKKDNVVYKNKSNITNEVYNKNGKKGRLINKDKVPYITFDLLEDISFIKHGFSTRLGGVSKGDFATMNLSYSRNDNEGHVTKNYKLICDAIGLNVYNIVLSDQVHDTNIHLVTKEDKKSIIKGTDGLITNVKEIPLVTFYADCVPLYFVDMENKAIGLSHAGWRGTVAKMGIKTVKAMEKEFGSKPKNIVAIIGPSICGDCYEVGNDVAEEFKKIFSKKDADEILEKKENNKYNLDLWNANKKILLEAGILEENISISEICSACNSKLLYSHRVSNGKRGNMVAFLMLR